jgi:hypothetical protein
MLYLYKVFQFLEMLSAKKQVCEFKIFKNRNGINNDMFTSRISGCSNKVQYKELVTSTVDPKMSAKMRISQCLRSYGCIPSSYSKYA